MKLNENELEILKRVFKTTWDYVAPDLPSETQTSEFPRDTVFEVCADRLSTFANTVVEKHVVRKFLDLSMKEQEALKEKVLPFEIYE